MLRINKHSYRLTSRPSDLYAVKELCCLRAANECVRVLIYFIFRCLISVFIAECFQSLCPFVATAIASATTKIRIQISRVRRHAKTRHLFPEKKIVF